MKKTLSVFLALLHSCSMSQEQKSEEVRSTERAKPPTEKNYNDEAPLPAGWPKPGPYDVVVEKKYPTYRAAYTQAGVDGIAFWTLFSHIKRHDIPMTAPVEKTMSADAEMKMSEMGFLYQNTKVGSLGSDGKKVVVKDISAAKVLCYTWMGDDSDENLKKARAAIDIELLNRRVTSQGYRILGYNGPQTPKKSRTWELQAILP